MASRGCWLYALVLVIVLLFGSVCAYDDEDFENIAPILLSPGVPVDIYAPASNQWCNYTKISVPAGTAITTVDFVENNGDAVYSLSPFVYPRSYRSYSASCSYTLGSDNAPHWVICAAESGKVSGCDIGLPSMFTHGADFYVCVSRYGSTSANISAEVTFRAVGVNGTFNNTMQTATVHYDAATTSSYHWTVYNISIDSFVTKINGQTASSSHYIMIPGIDSGNWWSTGNSRAYPAPGNHLVFLRSDNSFYGDSLFTISTDAECTTGHGYYCLNLTSSIEFETTVNGTLLGQTGVVYSFVTPAAAFGSLSVTFDMRDTNPYGNRYYLYLSGQGYNAHGQIPPYAWGQYVSISANGNATLQLQSSREYFVALYNSASSTEYPYELTINVSCPTCRNNAVCSATSAPYECSCTQGYGTDNCLARTLTIQDGFGQLTGVPEEDRYVFFEFTAVNYVGYLINVTQFDTATKSDIYMYGLGVVDMTSRIPVFMSTSSGTSAYSIYVPASSLVAQHKYIGLISQGGYSNNPRTINVTVSEFSHAPVDPSETGGASVVASSLSLLILIIAMALSALTF